MEAFAEYDPVSVKVVEGRGVAFVEVPARRAYAMVRDTDGSKLEGRLLSVSIARPRENERTITQDQNDQRERAPYPGRDAARGFDANRDHRVEGSRPGQAPRYEREGGFRSDSRVDHGAPRADLRGGHLPSGRQSNLNGSRGDRQSSPPGSQHPDSGQGARGPAQAHESGYRGGSGPHDRQPRKWEPRDGATQEPKANVPTGGSSTGGRPRKVFKKQS
jgi:hypothetical protein